MPETISVTEAARHFSDVINRVYYQGQSYLLIRSGSVVAQITAAPSPLTSQDLLRRWADRPRLNPEDAARWADELAATRAAIQAPTEQSWDT